MPIKDRNSYCSQHGRRHKLNFSLRAYYSFGRSLFIYLKALYQLLRLFSSRIYSTIPKSAIKRETREESIRKWQNQWEETNKGAITKEFFSKCRKKTGSEFTIKHKCNNNYEWAGKYSILPTPIKNHRQSGVSMQKRHTNNRPFDISVWKVNVRKRNTKE